MDEQDNIDDAAASQQHLEAMRRWYEERWGMDLDPWPAYPDCHQDSVPRGDIELARSIFGEPSGVVFIDSGPTGTHIGYAPKKVLVR